MKTKKRILRIENLERKDLCAGMNPGQPLDVNADTYVTSLDVLVVINFLNDRGSGGDGEGEIVNPPYLDVNGDAFISPLDALIIINALNAHVPIASAQLKTDTGTVGDRITTDPTISASLVSYDFRHDEVFAGLNISNDADLVDISPLFTSRSIDLDRIALESLLNSSLGPGNYTLKIVTKTIGREVNRFDFDFQLT